MDVTTIMLWAIVIGLGYLGWRWHKKGRSLEELARSIQRVLRRGLSVADTEEVKAIQTQLNQFHTPVDARLASLEVQLSSALSRPRTTESTSRPPTPTEVKISRLGSSPQPLTPSVHSIVWQGLRFTVSDEFWSHAGSMKADDVTDDQVAVMIQGPFCPGCLKRWMSRAVAPTSYLPTHCRFCGLLGSLDRPVQVREVKRLVYEYLDQQIRDQSRGSALDGSS
jgi:hypothetical protein